jgi:outer membrane scaffolding protein for murein synthesis (MipA/OmpV family)
LAQSGALEIHNKPSYFAGAIALVPDYIGSDDYTIAGAPAGRITFDSKRDLQLKATSLTSNLINHEFFRFGPAINYRFGRDDVDDDIVDLMKDIDGAFEIGAVMGWDFSNDSNPRYRFGVFLEFLQDVSGEHDGYLVTGTVKYWKPLGRAFDFGLQGGVSYGSQDYMNTYFGVSASDSALSGLPTYSANDGIRDVTITPSLIYHLSKKWHVGGFVRYQMILSDAADSPLVDQRGDANQILVGLGLAYSW